MAKQQAKSTDQGMLTVTNYDHNILTSDYIQNCIHIIRGEQVILDRDLARLYQVDTSQLNRQVKRNIERFPEDFMFQLTKEEISDLKCQNGTSSWGGDRVASGMPGIMYRNLSEVPSSESSSSTISWMNVC